MRWERGEDLLVEGVLGQRYWNQPGRERQTPVVGLPSLVRGLRSLGLGTRGSGRDGEQACPTGGFPPAEMWFGIFCLFALRFPLTCSILFVWCCYMEPVPSD